jgi:divalent metal cation (Fe/Co/Zn/Cd) transporter
LILGIAVVWATGITLLDNIISIAFGAFVLYTGYKIFRKSISGIMDEIDMDLVESIVDDLNKERQEDWIDVHNLRVIKFGRDIHIDCHLTMPWYYSLSEAHEQVDKFELLLKKHIGGNAEFFIHADPCEEHSCSICSLRDCPERKHAFVKKVHWQTDNVLTNRKHQE